jgi:hypothetical protein
MPVCLSMIQSQSAKRRAHSVKGKNRPVGASSACDKTCGRNLSYRNEDVAPTYRPKRFALCVIDLDFDSLINQNGNNLLLLYSTVGIRE